MVSRMDDADKAGERPGADPVAAAITIGQGGTLDPRAAAFLEKQGRLVDLQIEEQLREDQIRHWSLVVRHISDVLKLTLEVTLAAAALAVLVGFAALIWSALRDDGVVIEAFKVPPDLATQGLSGDVVATKLLDKLNVLENATQSSRASSSYANNWDGDIKLQIPDTGVSIGEFTRALHAWLGHQTRITGEIWHTPTGIAVTARAGSNASPAFAGAPADLDGLLQKAAEAVYRATQPYRYAVYLMSANRTKEAEAAYQDLIANGSAQDRAWAFIGLGNIYSSRADYPHALAAFENALTLRPDFVMAYTNIAGNEDQLQHEEQSYAAMSKVVAVTRGTPDPDIGDQAWAMGTLNGPSQLAGDIGDFQAQLAFNRQLETYPELNQVVENARESDIAAYGFMHDENALRKRYAELPPTTDQNVLFARLANDAIAELIFGNPTMVLAKRTVFETLLPKLGPVGTVIIARQVWPDTAYALALAGNFHDAHGLIDRTPRDCFTCLRYRGAIRELEKNWPAAEFWDERAAEFAPSLPFAWTDWGRVRLEKGDADGAIAKLEIAHARSPHFADPLEYWGEALVAMNHADLALPKFEEAAKDAPNWGRVHLKWGEALNYTGRKTEAAQQFALAARLELTPHERAELARS
jgi:tetratricopeptide (TPR) repeat protein